MSDPPVEPFDGTVRDVSLAFLRSPRDQEVLEKAAVTKGVVAAPSPGSFLGKVREPVADLSICLSVQPMGLAMHLQLPPAAQVDRSNWAACLAEPARALHLKGALEALPEQFGMHVGSEGSVGEARGVTIATLRQLLERSGHEKQPLRISWVLPSALALAHVRELGDQLEDAAVALADVYKLVAWAVDNDLLGICDEPTTKAPEAHGREVAARTKGKKSTQREEPSRRKGRKKSGTEDASWASEADERESVPDATAEGHAASKPASLPLPPRSNPPRPLRAFARGGAFRGDEDPKMPIEKGVKVRVRTGPFQNKSGVVQELDGKGSARVLLGLLATWIDVRQLVGCIEGRDRPMLGSSHRKRTSGR